MVFHSTITTNHLSRHCFTPARTPGLFNSHPPADYPPTHLSANRRPPNLSSEKLKLPFPPPQTAAPPLTSPPQNSSSHSLFRKSSWASKHPLGPSRISPRSLAIFRETWAPITILIFRMADCRTQRFALLFPVSTVTRSNRRIRDKSCGFSGKTAKTAESDLKTALFTEIARTLPAKTPEPAGNARTLPTETP